MDIYRKGLLIPALTAEKKKNTAPSLLVNL